MILANHGIISSSGGELPIVTSGLILNLDASKASSYPGYGTTWTDLSGQNNNGTLVNGTGYSSSNGGYLTFDGINDYVGVPIINFGTSDFTMSFWVKPTQSTVTDGLIGQGLYAENTAGYIWAVLTNNTATRRIQFSVGSNGVNNKTLYCDNSYTLNAWNFITLTFSSVSKDMFAYVNGVKKTSTYTLSGGFNTSTLQNINPNNTAGRKMSICMYDESRTLFPLTGNLSQTLINLVALSDAEILQNFNATKTRFGL